MKSGPPKIIALVGPKHCGKSSVAAALEQEQICRAADLDFLIEKNTGKKVRALYLEGQDVFHHAEEAALRRVLRQEAGRAASPPLALATGGGIIDNKAAWDALLRAEDTLVVYLETPAETAWRRVAAAAASGSGLPAFLQSAENPEAAHRALHERRAAAYRAAAHRTLDAASSSPLALCRALAGLISD
jgi:shikimate kinase